MKRFVYCYEQSNMSDTKHAINFKCRVLSAIYGAKITHEKKSKETLKVKVSLYKSR